MRALFLAALLSFTLIAGELVIAGGAGYKRPITELLELFVKESGVRVNPIFGNMQQIKQQLDHTDKVALFFGDEAFITRLGVKYEEVVELGKGKLVLVFAKEKEGTVKTLFEKRIATIAMPDPKRAIYGNAANTFLTPHLDALKEKLVVVQTVPQVSAYLLSGDVDAGFLNETDYLGIAQKVGNRVVIEESLYAPIRIIAVVLEGKQSPETDLFVAFLKSQEARHILTKHGL